MHAFAGTRSQLGQCESGPESVGMLIANAIRGARVVADARGRAVTVEFSGMTAPPLVLLVPENPAAAPHVVLATVTDAAAQARFENVLAGSYLLSIYPSGNVTP